MRAVLICSSILLALTQADKIVFDTGLPSLNDTRAKVVFAGMHGSTSHVITMMPLATRINKDNHYVHFLQSDSVPKPFNYPEPIAYTYVKFNDDPEFYKRVFSKIWKVEYGPNDFVYMWRSSNEALRGMLQLHPEKVDKFFNSSWDFVVADELFAIPAYGIALKQKNKGVHYGIMGTCATMHLFRTHLSYGSNWIHRPSFYTPIQRRFDMNVFSHRLHAFLHGLWITVGVTLDTKLTAASNLPLIGVHSNSVVQEFVSKSSYIFVDALNSLVWPHPIGNDAIHVSYDCPRTKCLDEEYRSFMEDPKSKGTIMIAFGSNVRWEYATPHVFEAFKEGINRLSDYRIVFSFNGKMEQVRGIGSHCKITRWAPQKEILSHNSTRVFLSHGGMKSVKDAVCAEVPVVFMPVFAEQAHNSEMIRTAGFAKVLDKHTLTADDFVHSLLSVMHNPEYKKQAVRFKSVMVDQPISSLDLTAFAAGRAIRQKGKEIMFRRKGIDLSMETYCYFDLISVIIGVFVISMS
ncbi:unnamed protein product [Auanema sp. JU1783]|nr:unnamed protein product [Auanema sp. JU1783]